MITRLEGGTCGESPRENGVETIGYDDQRRPWRDCVSQKHNDGLTLMCKTVFSDRLPTENAGQSVIKKGVDAAYNSVAVDEASEMCDMARQKN